jgi:DNA-directed RNA polymerase subunit RPC12/RpoP
MQEIQTIRCPNCGSPAERFSVTRENLSHTHTQCSTCDYLMILCSRTGNVVEAYAPGIPARSF